MAKTKKVINQTRIDEFTSDYAKLNKSTIRYNLDNLLNACDVQHKALAKCLGVTKQTISNWMDDNKMPRQIEVGYKLFLFLENYVPGFKLKMMSNDKLDIKKIREEYEYKQKMLGFVYSFINNDISKDEFINAILGKEECKTQTFDE